MERTLRNRRLSMVAAAAIMACVVAAIGMGQQSGDTAAPDFVYHEVRTDAFGECEIPGEIAAGQRVECLIELGLKRDMGRAIGILESSPLEAWVVVPERLSPRGFHDKHFDFQSAEVAVKSDGSVYVSFVMPTGVLECDLHFVVQLQGGTALRETAERSATVSYYRRDRQTIQIKAFAK